jgi:hypothetical protein
MRNELQILVEVVREIILQLANRELSNDKSIELLEELDRIEKRLNGDYD